MSEVVAGEVQQSEVREPAVLVIAVGMVDFDSAVHREEEPAMRAPSALRREKFPSGCVQPEGLSSARAPGAPVALLWAYPCTPWSVSFAMGFCVPCYGTGSSRDTMRAPTDFLDVLLHYPLGAFLGVLPFCPTVYLVPQQPV